MASPFEILAVDRDADEDEIKEAYRERVKEAHPDHGGSAREFERVRAAYEEIKDGAHLENGDGLAVGDESASSSAGPGAEPAGRGPATGRAAPGEDGEAGEDEAVSEERCRVEYVNYEVFDDYGWDLADADVFDRAADAGLEDEDYGQFWIRPRESLLEAAERRGFAWPFACRGGACANCAVYLAEGEMTTRVDNVLTQELVDHGFQLSCNGIPLTDELKVVYNVKHVPELEELLLPPRPFEQAHLD